VTVEGMVLAGLLILNAAIAFFADRRTRKMAMEVHTVNVATDGINKALVKTTGEAEHAKGFEEARVEGETKAARLVKDKSKRTCFSGLHIQPPNVD
jgi:hypothetical protein